MTQDRHIFIRNIYYMLSYAFTVLEQGGYEDVKKEEFDNIHNLFAAILAKGIGRQLKQGLYREYVNKREDVHVVRGKIDIPGTVRNRLSRRTELSCEYDELSENNLLNQIIKSTVALLLRHKSVAQKQKDTLKREMLLFSAVEFVDLRSVHWAEIRFQRNNATYRMLISICQLISEGMLQTTEEGEQRLVSFLDEQRMCRLYERFLLEYYIKEHPEITASASRIPWALDDGVGTLLPVMQSDILLRQGNTVLIIDAKYYSRTLQSHHDVNTIHSANLYQIFTYVKNQAAYLGNQPSTVSGMLLYAATDEDLQPNQSYMMDGNKISVRTLDLNQEFSMIADQLDRIISEHFTVH